MTVEIAGRIERFADLIRFYQAAAVNAAFGFGLYSVFVYAGMNMFVAQIVGHCIGVVFNYFTYSRHAFRGAAPAKLRFLGAYAINYVVGLVALLLTSSFIPSPYLAMAVAIVIATIINFVALKYGVFVKPAS